MRRSGSGHAPKREPGTVPLQPVLPRALEEAILQLRPAFDPGFDRRARAGASAPSGLYAAQSGCPHWQRGSGVPDISISAHRSLQNLLLPRSTGASSQRQPAWSQFSSFCDTDRFLAPLALLGIVSVGSPRKVRRPRALGGLLLELFRREASRVIGRPGFSAFASDRAFRQGKNRRRGSFAGLIGAPLYLGLHVPQDRGDRMGGGA